MRETNSTLQATASIRRLKYHTFFGRHFRHRFCIVSRIVLFFVFAKYVFISYLLSFGIKCHLHLVLPKRTEQSFAFEKCTKLFSSVFSEHKMEHAQCIRWMIHMHSRFYVKCWHFLLGKKIRICLGPFVCDNQCRIFACRSLPIVLLYGIWFGNICEMAIGQFINLTESNRKSCPYPIESRQHIFFVCLGTARKKHGKKYVQISKWWTYECV